MRTYIAILLHLPAIQSTLRHTIRQLARATIPAGLNTAMIVMDTPMVVLDTAMIPDLALVPDTIRATIMATIGYRSPLKIAAAPTRTLGAPVNVDMDMDVVAVGVLEETSPDSMGPTAVRPESLHPRRRMRLSTTLLHISRPRRRCSSLARRSIRSQSRPDRGSME
jgi:hypothetical protein